MKAYRFSEEADLEFQGPVDYFAEHAPGVGERFIADVDAAVRDIRAHPEIGSRLLAKAPSRAPAMTHEAVWLRLPIAAMSDL